MNAVQRGKRKLYADAGADAMRNLCGKSRARRRGAAVERSSVAELLIFFLSVGMQGVVRSVCAGAGQMQRFTEGVFLPARGRARDAFRLALPRAFRRSAVLVARNFSELRKVTEMAEWKFCVLPAFRRRVVHAVGMRSSCCRRLSLGLGHPGRRGRIMVVWNVVV